MSETQAAKALIAPLTSLRFFAALWVILYTYWPHLAGHGEIGLITKGYLGVDLFFILSGFILCHVYLDSFGEKGFANGFGYARFLNLRVARIYPLHFATLLATIAMVALAQWRGLSLDANIANWQALPAQLTLTHAWGLAPSASFNHPSWSISAEWLAYLAFPAFAFVAWRLKARPLLALGGAIISLCVFYFGFQAFQPQGLTHATVFWGALRIIPSFGLGCALYLVFKAGRVDKPTVYLSLFGVAACVLVLSTSLGLHDSITVIAAGLMLLALAGQARGSEAKAKAPFMSHPWLVYLGEVSFAMYMVYVPWKWVFFKVASMALGSQDQTLPVLWWMGGLLAIVPIAMAAHHWVELPMQKRVRAWGSEIGNLYNQGRQARKTKATGSI